MGDEPLAPALPRQLSEPGVRLEDRVSRHIVDAAIEVHRTLGGPGLLESIYEEALVWELGTRGLIVRRQVPLPITYKGHQLRPRFKLDLIVDGCVIVECKVATPYNRIFEAQVLTYLRLTGLRLGMVINFGERLVADGIHRVVNGLSGPEPRIRADEEGAKTSSDTATPGRQDATVTDK